MYAGSEYHAPFQAVLDSDNWLNIVTPDLAQAVEQGIYTFGSALCRRVSLRGLLQRHSAFSLGANR